MLLSIGTQTFVALPPRDHALICMETFGPFENSRPAGRALLTALKVEWQSYHKPFPDMHATGHCKFPSAVSLDDDCHNSIQPRAIHKFYSAMMTSVTSTKFIYSHFHDLI